MMNCELCKTPINFCEVGKLACRDKSEIKEMILEAKVAFAVFAFFMIAFFSALGFFISLITSSSVDFSNGVDTFLEKLYIGILIMCVLVLLILSLTFSRYFLIKTVYSYQVKLEKNKE